MKKRIINFIKFSIRVIQYIYGWIIKDNHTILYYPPIKDLNRLTDLKVRFKFYTNSEYSILKSTSFIQAIVTKNNLLLLDKLTIKTRILLNQRVNTFYIDQFHNPLDGWEWCKFSLHISSSQPNIEAAKNEFIRYVHKIQSKNYTRAYLFGTGPSLEKAIEKTWDDGYRIVCNTIVRDKALWKHIDPHFIVAGDAIYHFGFTPFAMAFRKDLKARLIETSARFIYPLLFHELIMREMSELKEKLIPIPKVQSKEMNYDLTRTYSLPNIGNILNLVLLPLGCTLAKNIYFWGFDGRGPNDKLFWSNSSKHTYSELSEELQKAHPKFFNHYVPENDPSKYVKEMHGDVLEDSMQEAETMGWKFTMMHPSWTPAFQKRYKA